MDKKDARMGHAGFKSAFGNIPRLLRNFILGENEHSDTGSQLMLTPQRKCIALIKNLVPNFWTLRQLVLDHFAGTLLTAKIFLLIEKHHRFVIGDKNVGCLEMSMSSLAETYDSWPHYQACDLTGCRALMEVSRFYLEKAQGRGWKGNESNWDFISLFNNPVNLGK